jgi:hypothetical protein
LIIICVFNLQIHDLFRRQQERDIINIQHQERERERERDEREAQRRMDAEFAQRNYDRERMEQLRIQYPSSRLPYGARFPEESNLISAQCLINAIITDTISKPNDVRERPVSYIVILLNILIAY